MKSLIIHLLILNWKLRSSNIWSFFVSLYGGGPASTINDQRKEIFCHRNQNPDMLPPTQDALLQHCRRALYQASIWVSAHQSEMKPPHPCNHGWKEQDGKLLPVWITIPTVSTACQILVKCGCKKPCSKNCSCKKKQSSCTHLCKCPCKKT